MSEYPKTENLYARDDATKKLVLGQYRRRDFEQVGAWLVTEKIDGTNVRIVFQAARDDEPGFAEVRGRSDAAVLPKNFQEEAVPQLTYGLADAALAMVNQSGKAEAMVVYGEGYGPGIQGGVNYADHKSLRVFDVVTYARSDDGTYSRPLWRTWEDVEKVTAALGLRTVPVLIENARTETVLNFVESCPFSRVAAEHRRVADVEELRVMKLRVMEGVVARTDPYLFDYRGDRVLFKLKLADLPHTNE